MQAGKKLQIEHNHTLTGKVNFLALTISQTTCFWFLFNRFPFSYYIYIYIWNAKEKMNHKFFITTTVSSHTHTHNMKKNKHQYFIDFFTSVKNSLIKQRKWTDRTFSNILLYIYISGFFSHIQWLYFQILCCFWSVVRRSFKRLNLRYSRHLQHISVY